jgi:hypothetical protein
MSTQPRAGLRAARALLSLLEDHSAEDFEAAEALLGSDEKLTALLRLLRQFQVREDDPLSVERLFDIVRRELLGLRLSPADMQAVASNFGAPTAPGLAADEALDQAIESIHHLELPGLQVAKLILLLLAGFQQAGPEQEAKLEPLLRELAARALCENVLFFPTPDSLAELRVEWADKPLAHQPHESRAEIVSRLFLDAERLRPDDLLAITSTLLRMGLRCSADGEVAALRRLKTKKLHAD